MLTSFFSNSRPINFIIVAFYILVFYLDCNFNSLFSGLLLGCYYWKRECLLLIILSVFMLNFVSGRNELTGRNAL